MAKYVHLSRIYLGDEEYYELLSQKNIAHRELLRLARRRGLVFSEKIRDVDLRAKLALIPSDWSSVKFIFDSMARPDPEERKTSVHVRNCADDNKVEELVRTITEQRAAKCGEIYVPVKISPTTMRVEVTYTDVDYSRAIVYQRREKKLWIEIAQNGQTISFIHNANERGKHIVEALKAEIKLAEGKPRKEDAISLFGVTDPLLRTKFFTQLIRGVEGYKYENTTHVDVDRRLPSIEADATEEESTEQKKLRTRKAEKIKGLINNLALTGEQILATDLYQEVTASGYYVCNICWSCVDKKDSRTHIDCEAGFSDPIKADQFTFDVVRRWQYKLESPTTEEPLPILPSEKRQLNGLLEGAAFQSFEAIKKEMAVK